MMIKSIQRILIISSTVALVSACSSFFDKDNLPTPTPLTTFTATVQPKLAWSTSAGSGSGDGYLKMAPAMSENALFIASVNGKVTALAKQTGQHLWQYNSSLDLSSGPGIGSGIVVVGSRDGDVIAIQQQTGQLRWKTKVDGVVIANPTISNGHVLIKTTTGSVTAFSAASGAKEWRYNQEEPSLILHDASSPAVQGKYAAIGFANGHLVKLNINTGNEAWNQYAAVPEGAFTIQRMVDIDANPIISGDRLYTGTYQGKLSAIDWSNGRVLWSGSFSTYTGMTLDADYVYAADANGLVWSYNAYNGRTIWKQTKLTARVISGPAIQGNYVVVGDEEGYLHWINRATGKFAGRTSVGSAIYATPVVSDGMLYVYTKNGYVFAYQLK